MSEHPAFELIREQQIAEVGSLARLYRHKKTGAEVMSLINDDENKVFGIAFKTPPEDSTGVAHILEHMVLCGSRKYPVKKPFVEMLKGSLQTFLNAMTFSDKTAYPVASQNLQDFYNLIDVYLDAVFFPLITEDTFRQEGWHYELESVQAPMVYKGVVFNEMKGAYSTPDAVLGKLSQTSLYPDTTYGVNSGGDPKAIPDLTYQYLKNFHARFYHPSNARAVFYGDDDPARRLEILDGYFSQFERIDPRSEIGVQQRGAGARRIEATYAANEADAGARTGFVQVNWLLDPIEDESLVLALNLLESILLGTPAAPLRKALIDSGLGAGMTGSGFAESMKQPYFTFGMKGIDAADSGKVEALIIGTLTRLADEGIDPKTVESTLNAAEFRLRENNTGALPRGISLMFRSLGSWLYGGDPFAPLQFEAPLAALRQRLARGERVFEDLIRRYLLDNPDRTMVVLRADTGQAAREAEEERARLDAVQQELDAEGLKAIAEETRRLKALQEAGDPPEALAKVPTLTLADLPRRNKPIPIERDRIGEVRLYSHDIASNGIVYLDLGFDLQALPARLLPYLPIFIRALTQTGTSREDFVALTQRIGRLTGGVGASRWASARRQAEGIAAYLFLRGKAVPERVEDLLDIMFDVLTDARLDNRDRIRQLVLESKAGFESSLANMGNAIAGSRLRAGLNAADWLNETAGGVTQYVFLKQLASEVDSDWPKVRQALEDIRRLLIGRGGMVINATADGTVLAGLRPSLERFVGRMPANGGARLDWGFAPGGAAGEGLTFPGQVNYVAKGANLRALGYEPRGALGVALKHLNTTYLWDKVRVQGGAYGGGAAADPHSGALWFASYRDPNLLETLSVYDNVAGFLRQGIGAQDLTRSIIGMIGTVDTYRLPDAKGYASLLWELTGDTEEARQQRREDYLGTTDAQFRALADVFDSVARAGRVVVLGSDTAIRTANEERAGFLEVTKVL